MSSSDEQYLEYASDATRARYNDADDDGKNAILTNVVNKYKPAVDELESGGVFDLIDQLDNGCNLSGGRKKKMRGGDLAAVKTALKKLWVEIVASTFTPDNVLKSLPVAVIGIANPGAAGAAFSGVKSLLGLASSVCLTSSGMTAISIGALLLLYDVKFDSSNFQLPNSNQEQLNELNALKDELKKNLPKSTGKQVAISPTPQKVLDTLKKIQDEQAKASKAAEETGKAAAITTELEKVSKETAAISETAAPPSTPTAQAGGRKTKKRGMKKLRKTRRGIRAPLFKY
jgi:chaperonin cofactor prefoldin